MDKKSIFSSEHFIKKLYPNIIKPTIDCVAAHLDKDFIIETSLQSTLPESYQDDLAIIYEEKREWLKRVYFPNTGTSAKNLLDMHKIAAIVARCLLMKKPFAFNISAANTFKEKKDKNKDIVWLCNNYYANYKVAFDVAMGITLYDLLDRFRQTVIDETRSSKKEFDIIKKREREILDLILNEGLVYYQGERTILPITHESYYHSMILNLAINDINRRDFDYLGFATNCFQIQHYTMLYYVSLVDGKC